MRTIMLEVYSEVFSRVTAVRGEKEAGMGREEGLSLPYRELFVLQSCPKLE